MSHKSLAFAVAPAPWPVRHFRVQLSREQCQVPERVDDGIAFRLALRLAIEWPVRVPPPGHHVLDGKLGSRYALTAETRLFVAGRASQVVLHGLENHPQSSPT